MTGKIEDGRPREGDMVRMLGDPDGQVMWVTCSALGEEHDWEGVRDGILCEWVVDGEPATEVFRPGQLVVVSQTADVSGSPQ